uniref:Peptidase S1 domain-containing protein n=1 Tax=Macrostomum lignano TaxID=282301 RepID=A0A1I8IQ62_9PLAT
HRAALQTPNLHRIEMAEPHQQMLLFLLLGSLPLAHAECRSAITKYTVLSANHCLNKSKSVWQLSSGRSSSMLDCFVSSRSFRLGSVGLVQRSKRDASCALFRFGEVCRLLNMTSTTPTAGVAAESTCETVVDSEYDAIASNEHFSAVWVGDRGPALENLVCGSEGQRNPMKSLNVTWTSEGARMDGVSSRLWVDDPTGLDFTASYTWVLHLKRTPGKQSYLSWGSCCNASKEDIRFFGKNISLCLKLIPLMKIIYGSVLPANADQFFTVGVVRDTAAGRTQFFVKSEFFPEAKSLIASNMTASSGKSFCLKMGWQTLAQRSHQGCRRDQPGSD